MKKEARSLGKEKQSDLFCLKEHFKPTEIIELLKQIKYPGFSRDIVSFGLIKEIQIENQNLIIQIYYWLFHKF